jgi:hypothetical protein
MVLLQGIGVGGWRGLVECLPSKHDALSSNPSMTKKKKETGYSFIIREFFSIGGLDWRMVCLANFHYSLGVVSVPYHKDAINNSCPS